MPPVDIEGPGFPLLVFGAAVQIGALLANWNFSTEILPVLLGTKSNILEDPWLVGRLLSLFVAWTVWISSQGHSQLTTYQTLASALPIAASWIIVYVGNAHWLALAALIVAIIPVFALKVTAKDLFYGIPRPVLLLAAPAAALFLPARTPLSVVLTISIGTVAAFLPGYSPDPSVVDRLWSIHPALVAWVFVVLGQATPRNVIIAVLITMWGARLTTNFFVKGGYIGGIEDYRWAIVRRWYPGARFVFFHAVFVCFYQILLISSIVHPAALAAKSTVPLSLWDVAATVAAVLFLLGETVADSQMLSFQNRKAALRAAGEGPAWLAEGHQFGSAKRADTSARGSRRTASVDARSRAGGAVVIDGPAWSALSRDEKSEIADGFCSRGLWAVSRHPNYFCEVAFWWAIALFAVASVGGITTASGGCGLCAAAPAVVGTVFLTLLFVTPAASADLTEAISASKYRRYVDYKRVVPRFFPRLTPRYLPLRDDV